MLLTREQFKYQVFDRNKGLCVMCSQPAVDAHHIIDRSLWEDHGYYLDNGVALCSEHHLQAEKTIISCDELRKKAGITNILLPEHFFEDEKYDKWGNILLSEGRIIRGECFDRPEVQQLFREAGKITNFIEQIKFPRIYHVPWSPGLQKNDRMHRNMSFLDGKRVVATIKMDGENTSMYTDYIHARSIEPKRHESRDWVKALHGRIQYDIPLHWRICGENLYAFHSIQYFELQDYFMVFSIWNESNVSISWSEVEMWSNLLGLKTVPVLLKFTWGPNAEALLQKQLERYAQDHKDPIEGYVVRLEEPIPFSEHRLATAKYVRAGHVQTDEHWMNHKVIPNKLKEQV